MDWEEKLRTLNAEATSDHYVVSTYGDGMYCMPEGGVVADAFFAPTATAAIELALKNVRNSPDSSAV